MIHKKLPEADLYHNTYQNEAVDNAQQQLDHLKKTTKEVEGKIVSFFQTSLLSTQFRIEDSFGVTQYRENILHTLEGDNCMTKSYRITERTTAVQLLQPRAFYSELCPGQAG